MEGKTDIYTQKAEEYMISGDKKMKGNIFFENFKKKNKQEDLWIN